MANELPNSGLKMLNGNSLNSLQKPSNALLRAAVTSLTPSEKKLAEMLDVAAENSKMEPNDTLNQVFIHAFSQQPTAAIEWAFTEHMLSSRFFPAVTEIKELLDHWHAEQHRITEAATQQAEREETERRRESGETFGQAEVIDQFQKLLATKKFPPLSEGRREELRQKLAAIRRNKSKGDESPC